MELTTWTGETGLRRHYAEVRARLRTEPKYIPTKPKPRPFKPTWEPPWPRCEYAPALPPDNVVRLAEEAQHDPPEWRWTPPVIPDTVTIHGIMLVAAQHFGVSRVCLVSSRRSAKLALVRHAVMYLAMRHTERSSTQTALALGRRDHTTALHGAKKIERLIAAGHPIKADIDAIVAKLGISREVAE